MLRCENVFRKSGRGEQLLDDRELCAMVEADLKAFGTANRQAGEVANGAGEDLAEVVTVDDVVEKEVEDASVKVVDVEMTENKSLDSKSNKLVEDALKVKTDAQPAEKDASMEAVDKELDHLDQSLVKLLAYQRLQEILHDNPDLVFAYQRQATSLAMRVALEKPAKRSMPLPSQLLTRDDIERIAREFATPPSGGGGGGDGELASDRAFDSPLMARKRAKLDEMYSSNGFDELHTDAEKVHEITLRLEAPIRESKIRARAVLVPVGDVLAGKR